MKKSELLNIAKPILFNTEMIKAILDGRKTVTRRRIDWDIVNKCDMENNGTLLCYENEYGDHIRPEKLCRYQPESILYVRETWGKNPNYDEYYYKTRQSGIPPYTLKWKPSIHMPKEAARIFLLVKDVRVERLQDMSEDDAFAEGVSPWDNRCYARNGWSPTLYDPDSGGDCRPLHAFEDIWDSTIKKSDLRLYGWDANPYVWVIEFERIEV